MTISVSIRHRLGEFDLDAHFESSGRLTALFGPSGSGKTSIVNAIAGLTRPEHARIAIDGRTLVDTENGVFIPPHRRRIGYVFQDARLFPHLTVNQNLAYGSNFVPQSERRVDRGAVLDFLGIGHLGERRPASLSGGERQRVAIGRALLASPGLVLMDEPLASLDETRKSEILPYVERMRDEMRIPIVLVTHALAEVARLATDIVRLEQGKIVESGPADAILPGIGLQGGSWAGGEGGPFALVELEVTGDEPEYGLAVLRSTLGEWRLPRQGMPVGARLRARIRASDVMIATTAPAAISALNVIPAKIAAVEEVSAGQVLLHLESGTDRLVAGVTSRSVHMLGLAIGSEVYAVVKSVVIDGLPVASNCLGGMDSISKP